MNNGQGGQITDPFLRLKKMYPFIISLLPQPLLEFRDALTERSEQRKILRARKFAGLIHFNFLDHLPESGCPYSAFRQPGIVGQRLQAVINLGPLSDQVRPQPEYLQYLVALRLPPPEGRKLPPKQQIQDQLRIPPVVLVPRSGSFSY